MAKEKRLKMQFWLMMIPIILAMGLMLTSMFWLFYPYKTMEIENYVTTEKVYRPGDVLMYTFDYTKYNNLPAEVTRDIVDGSAHHIDDLFANIPSGTDLHYTGSAVLPLNLLPGVYRLRTTRTQQFNPIRKITLVSESTYFTIVK